MNNWRDDLTEQELELINTAQVYAANNLKGMGGHHMAMLNAKLVAKLDELSRPIPDVLHVRAIDDAALKRALEEYAAHRPYDGTRTLTVVPHTPLADLAARFAKEDENDKPDEE